MGIIRPCMPVRSLGVILFRIINLSFSFCYRMQHSTLLIRRDSHPAADFLISYNHVAFSFTHSLTRTYTHTHTSLNYLFFFLSFGIYLYRCKYNCLFHFFCEPCCLYMNICIKMLHVLNSFTLRVAPPHSD